MTSNEDITTKSTIENWGSSTNFEDISVEQVDKMVLEYSEARTKYEKLSKDTKELYSICEAIKFKIIAVLESAGKKKWEVDGIGRVSRTQRMSPKISDKIEMLKHFRSLGEDEYLGYVSVNSRTLGAYIKQEKENDPSFNMPGVELTEIPNISFTRSKK